jgi:hypothetical protein
VSSPFAAIEFSSIQPTAKASCDHEAFEQPGTSMKADPKTPKLQGEGDYDAARRYNDATKRFVDSGAVPAAARNAKPKTPAQAQELEQAEQAGRQHAKGEDPQVQRPQLQPQPIGAGKSAAKPASKNVDKRANHAAGEDEAADPVGDGHADADDAEQMPPPAHPNPSPDQQQLPGDGDPPERPGDAEQTAHPEHPYRSTMRRRKDATGAI